VEGLSAAADRQTSRFVAGSTRALATLDHLGESVTSLEEAEQSRDSYLAALHQIAKLNLHGTVSLKLGLIAAAWPLPDKLRGA
jgi:hypothetical protein